MSVSHHFLQDRVRRIRGVLLVVIALLTLPLSDEGTDCLSEQAVGVRAGGMRSAIQLPTLRLGAFDQDSARIAMEQGGDAEALYLCTQAVYERADIIQEGHHFTTPSGTRVWQYRVMSPGAKSLSFFFDRRSLPRGGTFVLDSFSPDEVRMGGFGAENNSESGNLSDTSHPLDDVVIEVQAPEGTALPKLRLAEVNHGCGTCYATGPAFGGNTLKQPYTCTPELSCYPEYEQIGRSV